MVSNIPPGFRALPLPIAQLSLAAVLKCDTSLNIEYRLALKECVICLRQSPDTLFFRAVFPDTSSTPLTRVFDCDTEKARDAETLGWLKDYFQLEVDLIALYNQWSELDPVFGKLRSRFAGIRMLRQDPWENLVSFICSQNNHISRITGMVQSLCTQFSPVLVSIPNPMSASPHADSLTYHAFPSPARLASPGTSAVLRSLGFGYRAEYVQRTAQMLVEAHGEHGAEEFMHRLRRRPTDEARDELLKFVGVGRKVADCVLLMSLDKREVVPVDTHVHQIAMKHYGMRGSSSGTKATMTPKLYNEVQIKLAGVWGDYAGWAHSVLFTADLKSFSAYGLPTPSPSMSPDNLRGKAKTKTILTVSHSEVSPVRKKKRKHVVMKTEAEHVLGDKLKSAVGDREQNLADRVKRRRRTVVQANAETIAM